MFLLYLNPFKSAKSCFINTCNDPLSKETQDVLTLNQNSTRDPSIQMIDSLAPYPLHILTSDGLREKFIFDRPSTSFYGSSFKSETDKLNHILLVGIDTRTNDFTYARADTIMITSIDKPKKEIKLTSILRDTYVKIPKHRSNRINATFSYGGASLLKQTINSNFDLNLQKHIVVDFKGFQRVIDVLGGLDVNIKPYEVKELNKCITGIGGSSKYFVKKSGSNHLNGHQALAYCRIRKVGGDDYERTQRQRTIIKSIIEKAKKLSLLDYPKLIKAIYPYVKTNITTKECFKLIYENYTTKDWHVESLQIPSKNLGKARMINSMWVIEPRLNECIKCIKEFMN